MSTVNEAISTILNGKVHTKVFIALQFLSSTMIIIIHVHMCTLWSVCVLTGGCVNVYMRSLSPSCQCVSVVNGNRVLAIHILTLRPCS